MPMTQRKFILLTRIIGVMVSLMIVLSTIVSVSIVRLNISTTNQIQSLMNDLTSDKSSTERIRLLDNEVQADNKEVGVLNSEIQALDKQLNAQSDLVSQLDNTVELMMNQGPW